jgi:hypothetical protein
MWTERSNDASPMIKPPTPSRMRDLLFLVILISICAIPVYVGVPRTKLYGSDILFFLDGGWRVVSGQRPHVDFSSAWGPVTYLVTATGLWLSGGRVEGLGLGDALVGLILGVWSYILLNTRTTKWLAFIGSLTVATLAIAPFPLGQPFFRSSHAMIYNRWGYALLALVLFEAFPGRGIESKRSLNTLAGGFSSGLACALMAFLKMSYCLVGIVLVGISCVLWRYVSRARLIGGLLGAGVVLAGMLLYLGSDLSPMIADLRMAAVSRSQTLSATQLRWIFLGSLDPFLLVPGLLAVLVALSIQDEQRGLWDVVRSLCIVLLTFAVYVAGVLTMWTNAQYGGFPLNAMLALVLLGEWSANAKPSPAVWRVGVLGLGLVIVAPQLISDLTGLGYAAWKSSVSPSAETRRFDAPRLAGLVMYEADPPAVSQLNGPGLVEYVNDGERLLRKYSAPGEVVATFDAYNPFPYVLNRRPPRGGMPGADYNYTFSDRLHPSPARFFGDADVVMFPKVPAAPGLFDGLLKTYGQSLKERFTPVTESSGWILYRARARTS